MRTIDRLIVLLRMFDADEDAVAKLETAINELRSTRSVNVESRASSGMEDLSLHVERLIELFRSRSASL
jgi:hypothetical protein